MQQFSRGGVLTPGAVSLELVCSYSLVPSPSYVRMLPFRNRFCDKKQKCFRGGLGTYLQRHAGQTRNMTSCCIARQLPKKFSLLVLAT